MAEESVAAPERIDPVQEPEKESDQHRAQGPWDSSEEAPETQRLDLGSMRVPVESGVEVQVNVAQKQNRIIGVTLVHGGSAIQVQPFAAPKSSGLWDEMREELRSQITEQGGKAEEFSGTFGTELRAVVPVEGKTNEEGHQMGQRMRFIGVDGPRWVLRGVIRGEAAVKPEAMARVEEIFAKIVVVRGEEPIPPREMLEIKVPPEQQEAMAAAVQRASEPSQGNGQE
nr:DUF3710 domain-containing protein [Haloactinospora alba]